jgi:Mrp family chromosome partitioning ATPase
VSSAYCESCGAQGELTFEDVMEGNATCGDCGGVLVLMADGEPEEESREDGFEAVSPDLPTQPVAILEGEPAAELPPLPSWDGSETREVAEESSSFDELQAAAEALLGSSGQEPEELETIELKPGESSSGRVSRAYDADQVDQTTRDWDIKPEKTSAPDETRSWDQAGLAAVPEGEATRSWEVVPEEGLPPAPPREDLLPGLRSSMPPTPPVSGSLFNFDRDPDWEALLDEGFQEMEEDDPTARRTVIRVPESAADRASEVSKIDDLLKPYGLISPETGAFQKPMTQRWKVEPRTQTFHVFARAQSPQPQSHVASVNFRDLDPAICTARFPNSPRAGRYTTLATRIGHSQTVLVTSSERGEGRTSVALNLALAAARAPSQEAILIEADLDGGSVAATLGVPTADLGLLSLLRDQSDPRAALIKFDLGSFHLLPRGRGGDRSHIPERLRDLLVELRTHYPRALFVIDGPPVREGAARLAPHVDGALLVVRKGRSAREEVAESIAALGRGRILGAVFNEA